MGRRREEEGAAPRYIWCGFCPLQDDVFHFASPVAMVSVPVFITESVRAHRALEKLFCSEREPRAAQEAPGSGWEGRGSGRPCSRSAAALPELSRRLPRGSFPACPLTALSVSGELRALSAWWPSPVLTPPPGSCLHLRMSPPVRSPCAADTPCAVLTSAACTLASGVWFRSHSQHLRHFADELPSGSEATLPGCEGSWQCRG